MFSLKSEHHVTICRAGRRCQAAVKQGAGRGSRRRAHLGVVGVVIEAVHEVLVLADPRGRLGSVHVLDEKAREGMCRLLH